MPALRVGCWEAEVQGIGRLHKKVQRSTDEQRTKLITASDADVQPHLGLQPLDPLQQVLHRPLRLLPARQIRPHAAQRCCRRRGRDGAGEMRRQEIRAVSDGGGGGQNDWAR